MSAQVAQQKLHNREYIKHQRYLSLPPGIYQIYTPASVFDVWVKQDLKLYIPFLALLDLTNAPVALGLVLLVNLVDLVALLVPLTVLPGSSRLRSSVAAVVIVHTCTWT